MVANVLGFYGAGNEPTALLLSFALYEMAIQPEIQQKLRREIKIAREANNGILDYTTVNKIDYLEMIISGT